MMTFRFSKAERETLSKSWGGASMRVSEERAERINCFLDAVESAINTWLFLRETTPIKAKAVKRNAERIAALSEKLLQLLTTEMRFLLGEPHVGFSPEQASQPRNRGKLHDAISGLEIIRDRSQRLERECTPANSRVNPDTNELVELLCQAYWHCFDERPGRSKHVDTSPFLMFARKLSSILSNSDRLGVAVVIGADRIRGVIDRS